MERLTKRDKAGCPRLIGVDKFSVFALLTTWEEDIVQNAIDRLAAFEDAMPLERAEELAKAEKDGRLVVLAVNPYLKPEQTNEVFICENGYVWPIYVTGCEVGPDGKDRLAVIYETVDGDVFCDTDIGKTIFLTRQEAEAALRKEAENG